MNSTLSPKASDLHFPVDGVADRRSSFRKDSSCTEKHLLKCAIDLHGSGANWKGETHEFTRTTLTMAIHGCPLVVASQSMTLCFDSPQLPFEIRGCHSKKLRQSVNPAKDVGHTFSSTSPLILWMT